MDTNYLTIVAFGLYLLLMVGIGIYFYKRTKSTSDYFLGGRQLGTLVTSMSAQASDMSGWILMGLPGAAYLFGIEAAWIAVGLVIGTYINWKFIAKRLRDYTEISGDSITIPQFLGNRFRDNSNILRLISAVFILVFFLIYTASGFVAGATLFSTVFNLEYSIALLIGALIVISYTFAGGFFAVCWTDLIQGVLMFIAIIIVPIGAVINLGGMGSFIEQANSINVNFLNPFISIDGATLGIISIVSSLAWGLGYFGQPHILIRFMGIKSSKDIKKSRRIAMVWVIISLIAAVAVGIIGRIFIGDGLTTGGNETVYMMMAMRIFPRFLAGMFLAAVMAAVMSTADSQLLVTASAITEDFYKAKIRKNASQKELVWVSRLTVIFVAIIACIIASNPNNTVLGLVEYAWAGFGATFGPLIILSLFWKKTTRNGAIAGIVVGGITTIVWRYLGGSLGGIFTLYEIIPGFILSLVTIYIVSICGESPENEITQEFNYVDSL